MLATEWTCRAVLSNRYWIAECVSLRTTRLAFGGSKVMLLVEEWIEGGICVRIGEALKLDALVGKQLPNHWRLR